MSFAAHGKWCGPGWSAGQWKDAKDLTEEDKLVPADDALDQACKNHDIAIAEGDPEANEKFEEEAGSLGIKGAAFAALVSRFGPSPQSILQNKKKMPRQHPKEEDYEAWKSSNSIRLKKKQNKARETQREFTRDENRVYAVDANGESNEQKRKSEEDLDDTSDRSRTQDEFPVENPDDAIHATIDEEMNQNMVTPQMVPRGRDPAITREDRPLRGARPQGSLTNLLNQVDTPMQDTTMESAPQAMRVAKSGANSDGNVATNRNVMPMYNTPREMGFLTETRTAILPISIYFSINKLDHKLPVKFRFMVNDTFNIFRECPVQIQQFPIEADNAHVNTRYETSFVGAPPNQTAEYHGFRPAQYVVPNARNKGLSTDMAYSLVQVRQNGVKYHKPVGVNYGRSIQFPSTTRCSTNGTATSTNGGFFGYASGGGIAANGDYAMAWRNYYERVYRARHVMECNWKLTIENAVEGSFHRGVACETVETVTTQTIATPTTPDNQPLSQMQRYKHIKYHQLACRNAQGGKVANIIQGKWTPNNNIRRDVVDEEQCKTWYPTKKVNGPSPADWKEYVQLLFYNDEMSDNQQAYFNCRFDANYVVQYRDLEGFIRFPNPDDTTTLLSINDCHLKEGQYPDDIESTQWPRNDETVSYSESLQLANTHHHAV